MGTEKEADETLKVEPDDIDVAKGEATPEILAELKEGKWYTLPMIAQHFGYSRPWITELCRRGRIRAVKPAGGQWRIPRSEFDRLTKEGIPPITRAVRRPPVLEIPAEEPPGPPPEPERKDKKPFRWPEDLLNILGR